MGADVGELMSSRWGESWYSWEEVDGEVSGDFFAKGGSHD